MYQTPYLFRLERFGAKKPSTEGFFAACKLAILVMRGDWDDVRAYRYKAERAAALIYAHFRNEFGFPIRQNGESQSDDSKN